MIRLVLLCFFIFFFFNDTATTEIYTLSLHDALPISYGDSPLPFPPLPIGAGYQHLHSSWLNVCSLVFPNNFRSEEHTSELQSRSDLVCRLLLEKKKNNKEQEYKY